MMAHNAKQDQDNGAYLAYHKILVHKFSYHASPFQGGGELGPNSGDCWLSSWFGSATVLGFAYCAYKRFFRKLSFSKKKRISTSVDQEALINFTGSKCPFSASLNESAAAPGLRGWRRVRRGWRRVRQLPSRTKAPRLASVLIFVRSCGTCVGVQTIPKHFAIAQRRIEWGCLSSSPEGQCLFFLFYRQHKHDAQILVRLHRAAPNPLFGWVFRIFCLCMVGPPFSKSIRL